MRFIPLTDSDKKSMLDIIGAKSINELYNNVPDECLLKEDINLPKHKSEGEVFNYFKEKSKKNISASESAFFLGAGCYFHEIPASVDHIIQRSEFLTSYTPYQPEISQGTLAVIFQFQSMIANITGMEIANASMYDGATAVAEAALMAKRITGRKNIHILGHLNHDYRDTIRTYFQCLEGEIKHEDPDQDAACVIIQNPDFLGNIQDLDYYRNLCDKTGALLVIAVTEILSLGLIPAPIQADIVAGEAQSIGVPMQFGGPHLGFFASRKQYLRQMPGRLCGITEDEEGRRSFVLTLNTREQHIRREKATSNICTNQGLCATAFTIHMSLLGENGFKKLALLNHAKACSLADGLSTIKGVTLDNKTFFNEFTITLPKDSKLVAKELLKHNIVAGLPLKGNKLLIAVTETCSDTDIDKFINKLKEIL